MRFWLFGVLSLAILGSIGCNELSQIGGLGDYGVFGNSDVVGEVEDVDNRAREIEIRTDSGQTAVVRYDDQTQVIYRQRNYSVANLERGDYIAARVQRDRDGRDFADTITVRESVQERSGTGRQTGSRLDRLEGRVESVDSRGGTFGIRDSRNRVISVSVAFNAPRSVRDRFDRLRSGDYVRIEGRAAGRDQFDLENFL
ncbi:MAG TPA: hypothetical protein VGH22_00725 [Candidatus Binatia bacterium]|jgi:hypothetical protein